MASEISWEFYRSFLGVLREGSLSGAARSLGLAQPTLGRHIAELEKSLGVPLFTRSQSGLLPTEAALALRSHAEAMNSTAASFRRAAESHGDWSRHWLEEVNEYKQPWRAPPVLSKALVLNSIKHYDGIASYG